MLYLDGRKAINASFITIAEDGFVGIGAALERIEFNGSGGFINILGAKVGIGTSSPDDELHVLTTSLAGGTRVRFEATGSSKDSVLFLESENGFESLAFRHNESDVWSLGNDRVTNDFYIEEDGCILGQGNTRLIIQEGGNIAIGMRTPLEKLQVADAIALSNTAEGNTGRLTFRTSREVHTLANAATSDTTTISVPSGARLFGASFTVNTAVVNDGDDTWSAAFVTGSSTTLGTAEAAAQNTKVNTQVVDELTTAIAQIRFTAQSGSFTAGVIEVVCYFWELTSLAN